MGHHAWRYCNAVHKPGHGMETMACAREADVVPRVNGLCPVISPDFTKSVQDSKKGKNPLTGVVCLLTTGGLISVRLGPAEKCQFCATSLVPLEPLLHLGLGGVCAPVP